MQIGQELTELCLKQKTKKYGLIQLESSWNAKKPFQGLLSHFQADGSFPDVIP
jgi:hypothetical protein